MLQRQITNAGGWLHTHPWAIVFFLLGTIVGVLLLALLTRQGSADAVASVVGAAIGSGLAVFGALWVSHNDNRRRKNTLIDCIQSLVRPVTANIDSLLEMLVKPDRDENVVRTQMKKSLGNAVATRKHLASLHDLFLGNPWEALLYNLLTAGFVLLERRLEELIEEADQTHHIMYGWPRRDFDDLKAAKVGLYGATRIIRD